MCKKDHNGWHGKSLPRPLEQKVVVQTFQKSKDVFPILPPQVNRKLLYDNIWPLLFLPLFKWKRLAQKDRTITTSNTFVENIRVLGDIVLDESIQTSYILTIRGIAAT